ncbi:hypothetical protein QBC41DRAFT_316173 [Cercophora samala]|uniref:Secreted protein n=1 Tax=Cercophora samala TaxID=330535 RepID=A0AA39ZHP5_9PEZI|nr:hypothetical protein QBC41DRAFT_316173 [Cercophora samala]
MRLSWSALIDRALSLLFLQVLDLSADSRTTMAKDEVLVNHIFPFNKPNFQLLERSQFLHVHSLILFHHIQGWSMSYPLLSFICQPSP